MLPAPSEGAAVTFDCHYELGQRPDHELVNLFQESYRFIKVALGDSYNLPLDGDGLPDAVQYYLLYAAALIHGAADASLTLTLHNLGREARIIGRQIFEYWIRAQYYANNPSSAKLFMLSTPFTEREILDQLGYDKSLERYKNLQNECAAVLARFPEFKVYSEPVLRSMVGAKHDPIATKFYAFLYRIPSQTIHATGAGFGTVMREEGVAVDSRETNPNIGLHMETWIALRFLALMNDHLSIDTGPKVVELDVRLQAIGDRLGEDFGAVN
jgi:hypothetical protein